VTDRPGLRPLIVRSRSEIRTVTLLAAFSAFLAMTLAFHLSSFAAGGSGLLDIGIVAAAWAYMSFEAVVRFRHGWVTFDVRSEQILWYRPLLRRWTLRRLDIDNVRVDELSDGVWIADGNVRISVPCDATHFERFVERLADSRSR